MARLPQPGGDAGNWGGILNDYLSATHDNTGKLKPNTVGTSQIQSDAVTSDQIAPGAVTKTDVGLSNVDNTTDLNKPISTATQTALNAKLATTDLDTQTAANINDNASATATALTASEEPKSLRANRGRPVRPQETVISNFSDATGWTNGPNGTWDLAVTGAAEGRVGKAFKVITNGATFCSASKTITAFDPTGKTLVMLVHVDDLGKLNELYVHLGADAAFNNANIYAPLPTSGTPIDSGKYVEVTFTRISISGSGAGTAPTYLKLLVNDRGTGAVIVKFGGLSFYTPTPLATGLVSLCFDDGSANHFTVARPILNRYRYRATVFPIISAIDTTGMTLDQLKTLAFRDGWEVGAHATTPARHTAWTSLAADVLDEELRAVKKFLTENGFKSESLAYPGGASNGVVRDTARRYFQYGRSTYGPAESLPPADPMGMRSVSVLNTDTLASIKGRVDTAKALKQWLVLTFHDIVTTPSSTYQWAAADLEALVDYINAQGVPVVPMGEAVEFARLPEALVSGADLAAKMDKAQNLADVANARTARSNLSVHGRLSGNTSGTNVSPSATKSDTLNGLPTMPQYTLNRYYELVVRARNGNSGNNGVTRIPFIVYRNGGNATITAAAVEQKISGVTIGLGTGTLQVALSCATDGTSITVDVYNNSADTYTVATVVNEAG